MLNGPYANQRIFRFYVSPRNSGFEVLKRPWREREYQDVSVWVVLSLVGCVYTKACSLNSNMQIKDDDDGLSYLTLLLCLSRDVVWWGLNYA